ncbi:glycosyltransferase [bacterium]|nr:glycosyltransferase [bacterium]
MHSPYEARARQSTFVRILLYTDLKVSASTLFWHRDLGLLTKAFRDLGHDAWLVVHPAFKTPPKTKSPTPKTSKKPAIWASPNDVRNPAWWQSHKPNLVILGLWTRPKYDPVRRAALSATPCVIERADSDGMRTASCGLSTYARRRYDYFRDRSSSWPGWLSIPTAGFYVFTQILLSPWIEYRLKKTLNLIPCLTLETPQSLRRWRDLARRIGADPTRMRFVPNAVQTHFFHTKSSVHKKNQTISVGRWESYQKNLPALRQRLNTYLEDHPNWLSWVVGSGLPAQSGHPRIRYLPPLPPKKLARLMQESKLFLFSSRYESFCLAAAEAMSCGCRVLGPAGLDATRFYKGLFSGRKILPRKAAWFFSPRRVAKELLQAFAPEGVFLEW